MEIKENEDNINEFLEIDEELINQNEGYIEETYKNKSIYILHYPSGKDIAVSYGNLDIIKNEQINHFCYTLNGSSGSPNLSLETFKLIGIHCGNSKDENEKCNKGIFIKYPINLFNKKIFTLSYKLNPNEFNYFYKRRIFGEKFVENNKDKCIMIINDKEYILSTDINKAIIKNESFEIKLKEIETITDMSYMFSNCENLPDISKWDTFNVKNMSYMFSNCENLPDISKWDTSNVTNMSYMFYQCKNIPDISQWNTSNVTNMDFMFYHCTNLPDISKWNTSNVTNMDFMFYECKNIPDISKWNTSNVTNMNSMFYNCANLPDISLWDTSKIDNFSLTTLKTIPINILFTIDDGRKINILGNEFMTFANLVKKFYIKANISNNNNNVIFFYDKYLFVTIIYFNYQFRNVNIFNLLNKYFK